MAHDAADVGVAAPHPDGVVLRVVVQPRASRTAVVGSYDGRLKVALKAPPVDGKANGELVRFIAGILQARRSDVRLLQGEASRRKRVLVRGATLADVRRAFGDLDP